MHITVLSLNLKNILLTTFS